MIMNKHPAKLLTTEYPYHLLTIDSMRELFNLMANLQQRGWEKISYELIPLLGRMNAASESQLEYLCAYDSTERPHAEFLEIEGWHSKNIKVLLDMHNKLGPLISVANDWLNGKYVGDSILEKTYASYMESAGKDWE